MSAKSSRGPGFLSLLALLFVGLKLAGVGVVAEWSWWLVLSPLWAPFAILVFLYAVACIGDALTKRR